MFLFAISLKKAKCIPGFSLTGGSIPTNKIGDDGNLYGCGVFTEMTVLDANLINETDSLKVEKEDPILVSPAEDSNQSVAPEEAKEVEKKENQKKQEQLTTYKKAGHTDNQ